VSPSREVAMMMAGMVMMMAHGEHEAP